MKSVIKEICITLLLCVAVVLVFGIVFYDYVPISKVVPNKVAYTIPNDVQTELNDNVSVQEIKPKEITYSVTSSDLKQYESATVYQPGNPNPFNAIPTGSANSIINSTGSNGNDSGGSSSSNGIQYYYPTSHSSTK